MHHNKAEEKKLCHILVSDLVVRKDPDVVGQSLRQAGHGVLAGGRAALGGVGDNLLVRPKGPAIASRAERFLWVPFDLVLGDGRSAIRRRGVPQHPENKMGGSTQEDIVGAKILTWEIQTCASTCDT